MPSNHSCFVWFVAAFVYLLHATMGGASWLARLLPSRSPRASARDPSSPFSAALDVASSSSTAAAGLPPPPLHGRSRIVPRCRERMRIRSNFEAKRLSELQLGSKVHKMCTGGLGLELRN